MSSDRDSDMTAAAFQKTNDLLGMEASSGLNLQAHDDLLLTREALAGSLVLLQNLNQSDRN